MTRSLQALFESLHAQPPTRADLYPLSNLTREEIDEAAETWLALPAETRTAVVAMLVEITENDFEVDFGQFFRLALSDPDATVQQIAVEGLWEDEDIRLVPLLISLLGQEHADNVRAAAATSLGRFILLGELGKLRPPTHRKTYDALLAICQAAGEPIEVYRRALEAIAYASEDTVCNLIRAAYAHPEEKMRISAVFAMGRSADNQWASCVIAELDSPNPEMRFEATRACGQIVLREALPTLIELTDDVDAEVREAALWSLGQIGGDEARRVLTRCARSDDEALCTTALDALRELEFLYGDLGAVLFPIDLDLDEDEIEEDEDIP